MKDNLKQIPTMGLYERPDGRKVLLVTLASTVRQPLLVQAVYMDQTGTVWSIPLSEFMQIEFEGVPRFRFIRELEVGLRELLATALLG